MEVVDSGIIDVIEGARSDGEMMTGKTMMMKMRKMKGTCTTHTMNRIGRD